MRRRNNSQQIINKQTNYLAQNRNILTNHTEKNGTYDTTIANDPNEQITNNIVDDSRHELHDARIEIS